MRDGDFRMNAELKEIRQMQQERWSVKAAKREQESEAEVGSLHPAYSAAGPTVAQGVCIVCGSALVLAFWRGHPDNKKVHCNYCGSEVTAWMHAKKQPNSSSNLQK